MIFPIEIAHLEVPIDEDHKDTKWNGSINQFGKKAKMRPERKREIRYAQQHFVNMRAVEGVTKRTCRYHFVNLAKTTPSNVNMKTLQIHSKCVFELAQHEIE